MRVLEETGEPMMPTEVSNALGESTNMLMPSLAEERGVALSTTLLDRLDLPFMGPIEDGRHCSSLTLCRLANRRRYMMSR
jgi:hypothetical protein